MAKSDDIIRVLVIDDDSEIRDLMQDALTYYGKRETGITFMIETLDSDNGLEKFSSEGGGSFSPDLAVVDHNFTEAKGGGKDDGLQKIVPRLKAMISMPDLYPEFERTKIVLYSAKLDDVEIESLRAEAIRAGAIDFWNKESVLDPKNFVQKCIDVLGVRKVGK